jgi:hypothetical protein
VYLSNNKGLHLQSTSILENLRDTLTFTYKGTVLVAGWLWFLIGKEQDKRLKAKEHQKPSLIRRPSPFCFIGLDKKGQRKCCIHIIPFPLHVALTQSGVVSNEGLFRRRDKKISFEFLRESPLGRI